MSKDSDEGRTAGEALPLLLFSCRKVLLDDSERTRDDIVTASAISQADETSSPGHNFVARTPANDG